MSKIRIKNFGPIQEGFKENGGFLEFKKVSVLIGNQATGKSSVAKLLSTITWLEKAIYKRELKITDITKYGRFVNRYCEYQGLKNYFQKKTEIEYQGKYITLIYRGGKCSISFNKLEEDFLPPKIMYVPAERNFLSVVERPEKLKYLPSPLYTFLEEFDSAKSQSGSSIALPINQISFEYQKQNKISYIKGEGYRLRLHETSSGIQSLLPLYLVSKYLAESVDKETTESIKSTSVEQENRLKKEIAEVLSRKDFDEHARNLLLSSLASFYRNLCFINIVEEPEQNLFPQSQKNLLYELIAFANKTSGNKLLLTTHSPYILNFLSIAIKANQVKKVLEANQNVKEQYAARLGEVVPIRSCISGEDVIIYEISEDGIISTLREYDGIPSDRNFLNNSLMDTNKDFDDLLAIEEEIL